MEKITIFVLSIFMVFTSSLATQNSIASAEENANNWQTPTRMAQDYLQANPSNMRVPVGSEVLLASDGSGSGAVNLEPLFSGQGANVTQIQNSDGILDTVLASQSWNLVVLQIHFYVLTGAEVTAIGDYLAGGGKRNYSLLGFGNDILLHGLLGVSNTISFDAPLPVFVWDALHPSFNNPNTVTGLSVIGDNAGNDNGDRMEPDATGIALAGFVATTTTNEGAIILANGGNSFVNGFGGADMDLVSFINLIENQVNFLVGNIPADAPTITSIEPGNAQATVSFTPGEDNGSPITGYRYIKDNGFVSSPDFATTGSKRVRGRNGWRRQRLHGKCRFQYRVEGDP